MDRAGSAVHTQPSTKEKREKRYSDAADTVTLLWKALEKKINNKETMQKRRVHHLHGSLFSHFYILSKLRRMYVRFFVLTIKQSSPSSNKLCIIVHNAERERDRQTEREKTQKRLLYI